MARTPSAHASTSASPLRFPLVLNCSGRGRRGMARRPGGPRMASARGTQCRTWFLLPWKFLADQAPTPCPPPRVLARGPF
eukprot:6229311-Pyramimonas_sp.AAC.1